MTPEEIADELIYRSYVYNRERFPEIKAERWIMAYPNAAEMERRYQDSINAYANASVQRDVESRHHGRPEHDMACDGVTLRAGT